MALISYSKRASIISIQMLHVEKCDCICKCKRRLQQLALWQLLATIVIAYVLINWSLCMLHVMCTHTHRMRMLFSAGLSLSF